ncbi:MAG: hypothetical protein P4M08_03750 [Oligoflexia bacterium]|nr:hypothetical protein [Oligoflexia bacterium]
MELNHDWRGFSAIFNPRRRSSAKLLAGETTVAPSSTVHIIADGSIILAAQSADGEDFSRWHGKSVEAFFDAYSGRELAIIDRKQADQKLTEALALSHIHEQAAFFRDESTVRVISRGKSKIQTGVDASAASHHFLIGALQGWWAKILPSSYGFFIRLEEAATAASNNPMARVSYREIFVLIRRGRLVLFHTPDLTSLGQDRSRAPAAVVKYLSEKHAVPVQGLVASADDWAEWSELGSDSLHARAAWKKLAVAIQSNEAQLVPFRWQAMTLIATRGFFGF